MEIELVPDPKDGDPAAEAAREAVAGERFAEDERPPGLDSAWRRAGVVESTERELLVERPTTRGPASGGRRPRPRTSA
jgi:hypothetical protein